MPTIVTSAALKGLEAVEVEVEADATPGLRFFNVVGLPSKVVEESKDRIASAIRNSGYLPYTAQNKRIIINLAPADLKKEGPLFDLPVAISYLMATKQIQANETRRLFVGELSLDGHLRPVTGVLSIVIMAQKAGYQEVVIPHQNIAEALLVKGIDVIGVKNLGQVIGHITGANVIKPGRQSEKEFSRPNFPVDFSDVRGQESAKEALIIAAAGGHNVLMYGPPGSGKTLLAKAFPSILPPLSYLESLEVTKLFSVAGLLGKTALIQNRPFRDPHHSASPHAIIGGGTIPRPGEISLAHRGVLFLDELPEFPRGVLESLRQPLEAGHVVVSRTAGTVKFPANFTLIAAMNPCPCGNFGSDKEDCLCSTGAVSRYQKKISGPLLDRIDLHLNVSRETIRKVSGRDESKKALDSTEISKKVILARDIQSKRFGAIKTNASMSSREVEKYCHLSEVDFRFVEKILDKKGISARGYHKILKVARTIADLQGMATIDKSHIAQAVHFRLFDSSNRFF
ncbi:MAG: magnesium chelatase [Candidatus Yanofskybacteria bacterium CG10_big_fil_rev_8_21_14_0_10_46_23]|uniref:Magnesium chelatase n=1 Tax=Candidatus Yanofskybacteria bacterium CG10_big_fil_rev_8_21_14_0_10_46_23 TaxID=1975098 RepID=A0A2H0R4N9_9BACT|nr:MAG: magnesium chelatase [Candidatus Yanofskybacteria bacterium CG10_big_fil_rev_8_21_14_0_10_46_23]